MPGSLATQPVFLFLQGPHGPFFDSLARRLRQTGATVWRVGFNAGDRAFWWHGPGYIPFRAPAEHWPAALSELISERRVTDLVVYGDTRPVHAQAVKIAKKAGLRVHVFEEGYLRPYWITYERNGANGHSAVMGLSIDAMADNLRNPGHQTRLPPGHWGDTRQHVFYGALYHACVLALNRGYPEFRPHRTLTVSAEFRLYLRRLALMPLHALERGAATLRIRWGGFPYHLVLLQLEHDASFRFHSDYPDMASFLREVIDGFSRGAPAHHHLVFKAHPLEDGRAPIRRDIRTLAAAFGLTGRVHYVGGGKLARLLDVARSAVTVNSTAGQQVLWRGLPLLCLGRAVYAKPGIVSDQSVADFFANPMKPDAAYYDVLRRYLLETSQIPGGYYAMRGRRTALRQIVDRMLADTDLGVSDTKPTAAHEQHLKVVR